MLLPPLVIDFIGKEDTVESDESKMEGHVDVKLDRLVNQPNRCCLDENSSPAEGVWTSCIWRSELHLRRTLRSRKPGKGRTGRENLFGHQGL